MHIIMATANAQPDQVEATTAILTTLSEVSRDEDGCIAYDFHTSIEDPTLFRSVELWDSAEAAAAHLGQPHVATALEDLAPLLATEPSIIQYGVADEVTIA